VGARFDDRVTNDLDKFCPHATIIHIDVDPTSISKNINAHIPVVGTCTSVLNEMLSIADEMAIQPDTDAIKDWWAKIDQWRADKGIYTANRYEPSAGDIIKPQDAIKALYKATDGNAYVTSDVGQHQMFAAQYYLFDKPRRWINSGGLGTMGFGLPAAMGVQLAFPDAQVACVTGEGSIQMCIQELSTCSQYNLPIKIINLNNSALGMVRQWQDMNYSSRYSQSLYEDSLPDFVALAEAYGHVGMKVTRYEDLEEKMRECFALKDRTVFMDICVDKSEHVYPMQIPGGAMGDLFLNKSEKT
jgi:acetolactate synthase-1/2/3 large subunit